MVGTDISNSRNGGATSSSSTALKSEWQRPPAVEARLVSETRLVNAMDPNTHRSDIAAFKKEEGVLLKAIGARRRLLDNIRAARAKHERELAQT
jgi:hypothetical protein